MLTQATTRFSYTSNCNKNTGTDKNHCICIK